MIGEKLRKWRTGDAIDHDFFNRRFELRRRPISALETLPGFLSIRDIGRGLGKRGCDLRGDFNVLDKA
jgi:hypothetical protein